MSEGKLARAMVAMVAVLGVGGCGNGGALHSPTAGAPDASIAAAPDAAADLGDRFADPDGDGLTTAEEQAGWSIVVDRAGFSLAFADFVEQAQVTSDPFTADTDGDGLLDGEEFAAKSDPRLADTDGDGLGDAEEMRRWRTSPVSVDSDGDSRDPRAPTTVPPDPRLFDGAELALQPDPLDPDGPPMPGPGATSPTLADSDGDGLADRAEQRSPVRRATVAELPQVQISVVDPLALRLQTEFVEAEAQAVSTEAVLSRDASRSVTEGHAAVTEAWSSATVGGSVGVSVGFPLQVILSGSTTVTTGFADAQTYSTTEAASQTAREALNTLARQALGRTVRQAGATLTASLRVRNPSGIAYVVDGLGVVVRQLGRPGQPSRTLAVLQPRAGYDGFSVGPGAESPVIPFFAQVDPGLARALLADPQGLVLEPAGLALTNAEGRDFVFVAEGVAALTGAVVVDDGQGPPRSARVAAAVDRTAQGGFAGARLAQALALLGEDVQLAPGPDGRPVITAVGEVAAVPADGPPPDLDDPPYPEGVGPGPREALRFWTLVGAATDLAQGPVDLQAPVDRVAVGPGQTLYLAYVADLDRDGVVDRVELARGASDEATDSDGDGLSDFFEIQVGWQVALEPGDDGPPQPPYPVFPAADAADGDGDGLADADEHSVGTDPRLPDTDGDGVSDGLDPNPLRPDNTAPTVEVVPAVSGRSLALTVDVADAEANLDRVVVDWGDGSAPVRAEFRDQLGEPAHRLELQHAYATDGDYPVTVTVVDLGDLEAQWSQVVSASEVPLGAIVTWDFEGSLLPGCLPYTADLERHRANFLDRDGDLGACAVIDGFRGSRQVRQPIPPHAGGFTWSLWVRPSDIYCCSQGHLFGYSSHPAIIYDRGQRVGVQTWINPQLGNPWDAEGADLDQWITDRALPRSQWSHLALVHRDDGGGSLVSLWVDGARVLNVRSNLDYMRNPACNLVLGPVGGGDPGDPCYLAWGSFSDESWTYDDVRIYDRPLGPDDIGLLAREAP